MDMKTMEKLEDGFCKVLHDNAERGFASASSVELAKTALSGLVKLKMLEEMENYNEGGMSGRYYYDDDRGMSGRHSYRRRDSMGRYADGGNMSYRRMYDGGMSGHDIRPQLERMMEEADSEMDRQAIRAALSKL